MSPDNVLGMVVAQIADNAIMISVFSKYFEDKIFMTGHWLVKIFYLKNLATGCYMVSHATVTSHELGLVTKGYITVHTNWILGFIL